MVHQISLANCLHKTLAHCYSQSKKYGRGSGGGTANVGSRQGEGLGMSWLKKVEKTQIILLYVKKYSYICQFKVTVKKLLYSYFSNKKEEYGVMKSVCR